MTDSLTLEDLMYELPPDRIATIPASPRPSSNMLVVHSDSFSHRNVSDLPNELPSNALLVVNETSVLPARFITRRVDSGGRVEGLFLEQVVGGNWLVMLKSNGKLRAGIKLELCEGVLLELVDPEGANWMCTCSDARIAGDILATCGSTPLPPYIIRARGDAKVDDTQDRLWYQTVFADPSQCHSVAAPTAGLHFDDALIVQLEAVGITRAPVTLHVGAGTFKAIETSSIENHQMHQERWSVSSSSLDTIRQAKLENRPIIAVGTTSVRTLESLPSMHDWPKSGGLSGETRLMITPPYDFRLVDGLLTNFHLPKSTLLALVAAMIGINHLKAAYSEAIERGYRFYSFGDAMLIPPH